VSAIARIVRAHRRAEVHATGDEAVNRALKAVDLAMDNFDQEGIQAQCMLEIRDVLIEEDMRPAIRLIVTCQSSLDVSTESNRLAVEDLHKPSTVTRRTTVK
jgi:stage V sporulation protein S